MHVEVRIDGSSRSLCRLFATLRARAFDDPGRHTVTTDWKDPAALTTCCGIAALGLSTIGRGHQDGVASRLRPEFGLAYR